MAKLPIKPDPSTPVNQGEPEMEEDPDIDMNIDPAATEKPAGDTETPLTGLTGTSLQHALRSGAFPGGAGPEQTNQLLQSWPVIHK